MGKSGQGYTYPFIIERPELKSTFRNSVETLLTVFLWWAWMYFIFPVFTLFLWFIGIKFFYYALFPGGGLFELYEVIRNSGLVIFVTFALYIVWINYNYYYIYKKFGERRRRPRVSSDKKIAQLLNIDPEVVEKAKKSICISVMLSENKLEVRG